jgi:hypothetical protein
MTVRKADDFIADVERQFDWFLWVARSEPATPFPCGLARAREPRHSLTV